MNKLLREFLSYILVEERVVRPAGKPWQTPGGKWSAKRNDGTRRSGFDSEEAANAWLRGTGRASGGDVPSDEQEPKDEPTTPTTEPTTPSTPPEDVASKTSGFLSKVKGALAPVIDLVDRFKDSVYRLGAVGTGTADSTKGEQSSCSSAEDFLGGRGQGADTIPVGITDEAIAQAKTGLTRPKAGVLGEPHDTRRAIEAAWIAREQQRYIDSGTEPPEKKWLKMAYRSGVSTRVTLEARADMQATQTALRDGTIPPPMVTSEGDDPTQHGQAVVRDYFTKLRDAAPEGSSERAHYDKILRALKKAKDTDTCVFYIDKKGNVGALFVSNKQSLNDPHGNTGPKARISRIASLAKSSGLSEQGQQSLGAAITRATDAIGASVAQAAEDVKNYFGGLSSRKRQQVDDRLQTLLTSPLPADRGTTRDYSAKILKLRPVQQQMATLYCTDNPEKCTTKKGVTKPTNPNSKEYQSYQKKNIGRAFSRAVEANPDHRKIRGILSKVGAVATDKRDQTLLGPVLTVGSAMKESAADAHGTIVREIHNIDKQECGDSWDDEAKACVGEDGKPENGPSTQTYVDAFMRDTHWDQYMCTDAPGDNCSDQEAVGETKLVDINGHKVSPQKFRECLGKLSGYTPPEGIEPNSREGQQGLWRHLKGALRVDPDEDSISVHGQSGRTIGRESYRTKGSQSALLTYLGKDMGDCVTS
jgi:hypothetical protein